MVLIPLPGVTTRALVEALRQTETDLINLRGAGGTALDQFNRYQEWANTAAHQLGRMLPASDVDRLVTTRRSWTIQSIDPATRTPSALSGFVQLEIEERLRDVEQAQRDLKEEIARWNARAGRLVVADTNVYLHHNSYFDDAPWGSVVSADEGVHLVVPLVVVDELDRRKRTARGEKVSETNPEPVRTRARLTLKRLDKLFPDPTSVATLPPPESSHAGAVTIELLMDDRHHVRLPDADNELVDRAVTVQQLSGRRVALVTFDVGMRTRAQAAGLEAVLLTEE